MNRRSLKDSPRKGSPSKSPSKSPFPTVDKQKIKELLASTKKNFPFKNPFYDYTDYINTKAIKKLLPPSAYKNECFPVIITKAFLKFNEILYTYEEKIFDIIDSKKTTFKVFLNAELPGSFLSCLYHFFETRKKTGLVSLSSGLVSLDWSASSLFEGKTFLDDKYGLVKKYPQRWLMNSSFNGDVTVFSNLKYIENVFYSEEKKVHLYTSDIGVGINEEIAPQEETNFFANVGQIYSGLVSLQEQGTLLIKTYTFFESYSEGLFELLYKVFDEVKIIKPSMSSKFNSEVYVICFGYLKKSFYKTYKESFEKYVERNLNNKTLYERYDIENASVFLTLEKAASFYFLKQAKNLEDFKLVISNYGKLMVNVKDFAKYFDKKSETYTGEWLEKYPIVVCEDSDAVGAFGDTRADENGQTSSLTITENFRTAENKEYEIGGVCKFKANFDNNYIFEKVKNKPILYSFYKDKKSIFIYDIDLKQKNKCNAITEMIVRYFEKEKSFFYSIIFEIKEEKCFVDTLVKSFGFKRIFNDDKKREYFEMIL